MAVRGSLRTCVNLCLAFCFEFAIKQYSQVSFLHAEVAPFGGDVSWFKSGISFASDQEYVMASLVLVHFATSNGSEGSLMDLMNKTVEISPGNTGQDGI